MRQKPEAVLRDIEEELKQREDLLTWGNTEVLLMQCQDMIESQQRQIVHLETALTQAEYRSKQWEERFNSGRLT